MTRLGVDLNTVFRGMNAGGSGLGVMEGRRENVL